MPDLLIPALACWYIAYALTKTHGPFSAFEWMRKHLPHGGLLECPVCLAFWAALVLLLVPSGIVVNALAVAGLAMLAHGYTGWRHGG
jgi:hypothetical protein